MYSVDCGLWTSGLADSRTLPEMKIALILADIERTCTSNELAVLLSVAEYL